VSGWFNSSTWSEVLAGPLVEVVEDEPVELPVFEDVVELVLVPVPNP
jgi:hypothetical protein